MNWFQVGEAADIIIGLALIAGILYLIIFDGGYLDWADYLLGGTVSLTILAVIGVILHALHDSSVHSDQICLRSHQEYVAPTYVMAGKVMVPVGGGMESVCDQYGPHGSAK